MNQRAIILTIVGIVVLAAVAYGANLAFNAPDSNTPDTNTNTTANQSSSSAESSLVDAETVDGYQVPSSALDYIKQTYPDYQIADIKDKDGTNNERYEIVITQGSGAELKKIDLYYNQQWSLLRTKVVQ